MRPAYSENKESFVRVKLFRCSRWWRFWDVFRPDVDSVLTSYNAAKYDGFYEVDIGISAGWSWCGCGK